jgi:hypothetical protein
MTRFLQEAHYKKGSEFETSKTGGKLSANPSI